ncbi:MAG: hypothetical protein ACOX75_01200 [Lachnospiraceae bacterium]
MSLLKLFATIRTDALTLVALLLALLNKEIFLLCALGVICWCHSKKMALKLMVAYVVAGPLTDIIKVVFHIEAPWIRDRSFSPAQPSADFMLKYNFPPATFLRTLVAGYAFPASGFFGFSTLAATVFVTKRRVMVKLLSVLAVLLVSSSIFYLGLRTPWSVLASLIIAATAAALADSFIEGTLFDKKQNLLYGALLMLPSFILLCTAVPLFFNDKITLDGLYDVIGRIGLYLGIITGWFVESMYINFSPRCDRRRMQVSKALLGIIYMLSVYFILGFVFSLIPGFRMGAFIRNYLTAGVAFAAYPAYIKSKYSSIIN